MKISQRISSQLVGQRMLATVGIAARTESAVATLHTRMPDRNRGVGDWPAFGFCHAPHEGHSIIGLTSHRGSDSQNCYR
jgi:hypothetical protein